MYSQVSESSLSSFFSANSTRRDTLVFLSDDYEDNYSGSDTVTESTCTPTSSSSSIALALNGLLAISNSQDLLSVSLSITTFSSCSSSASLTSIPPLSVKEASSGYYPLVHLKDSPFICPKQRLFGLCSEDMNLRAVVSSPTAPRLKSILMEKLYVAGWAVGGFILRFLLF
jgi:hypothetical protein